MIAERRPPPAAPAPSRKLAGWLARVGVAGGVVGALLGAGCARSDARDAAEPQQVVAHLSLTFTRVAGSATPRFDGQAHFVRYAASDADHVPAILGLPVGGLPDDHRVLPLDSCVVVDSAAALDRALVAARSTLPVKLLDAGRVTVKGPGDSCQLAARHYPELTPYVAGIVYGSDEGPALALEPGATYEVSAEGGEDIGPFASGVGAPRSFPALEVPTFRRGSDLEVRWSDEGAGANPATPPLTLTVSWSARGSAREVRCRVRDDGSFSIGRELLASMAPASQLLTAEVSALRTRSAVASAPGANAGELRVGLRDVVPLPLAIGPSAQPATAPGSTGDDR